MRDYADRGVHPGPLPNPGMFARHNSVDTPALLPDGTPSELSISRVMRARGTVRDVEGIQAETAEIVAEVTPDLTEDDRKPESGASQDRKPESGASQDRKRLEGRES